ncbi:chalcone isomerase family protein [Flavobacterium polysaccharolyticum]|uniref:Chalcone isomerase family protein n=1 Tax=Flavobacterium polysaccharolyticum TaxID=3133148 RepID=A0ABU9NT73_9FLAO
MKKNYLFYFTLLFFAAFSIGNAQTQFELKGVVVPRTIEFQDKKLQLNGFGTRTKLFMDMYVQALYLTTLSVDPKEIIESDTEMAIRMQIVSPLVTSQKLTKAFRKGLSNSAGEIVFEKHKTEIDYLISLLGREETKENDFFNLIYNPLDTSIWIYKNDKLEGKVKGFEFKKVLFGNWLSDKPVGEKLKKELLGLE